LTASHERVAKPKVKGKKWEEGAHKGKERRVLDKKKRELVKKY